jgi:hypothetical protein
MAMKYVYIIFDPLLETIVCVHDKPNETCDACKKREYKKRNTYQLVEVKRKVKRFLAVKTKKSVEKPPDPDDVQRKLRNDYEYNNLCARATLYPGKTIDEVDDIHFKQRIKEAYYFVNDVLVYGTLMNTKETRDWVICRLKERIENGVSVKCDEENNPSEVVDQKILIAKVMSKPKNGLPGYIYIDMIFGDTEQVAKYQDKYYLDNRMFNFIEKGL